jgi:hypothetical protein
MKMQKWVDLAEITASVGVIITLIILILDVRENTRALERQVHVERVSRLVAPYLENDAIPRVYARIKAVDGEDALVQAYADRYDLTIEDAVRWRSHLDQLWTTIEADFLFSGESEALDTLVADLLVYPDEQLYWEHSRPMFTKEFVVYLEAFSQEP